jgi:hypothetical protein
MASGAGTGRCGPGPARSTMGLATPPMEESMEPMLAPGPEEARARRIEAALDALVKLMAEMVAAQRDMAARLTAIEAGLRPRDAPPPPPA